MLKPSTYSIAGRDPQTGELGIAIQSKFLAAGAIVPHIQAGVGAVATQALANPAYGPRGLELLAQGYCPRETIEKLTGEDPDYAHRQVGIIDHQGRSAAFTGEECLDWAGAITGENFAVQGNILVGEATISAMARAFQEESGSLADRLLQALQAGQKAGGEKRGQQAAALVVYREKGGYGGLTDKYIDLRVDDDPRPIERLSSMLDLFYLYFSPREVDMIPLQGKNLREIKELLKDLNLYPGPIDEEFSPEFQEALQTFYYRENFEERIPSAREIPEDILNYLRKKRS